MTRTVQEIKKVMTDVWINNSNVRNKYGLQNTDTFDERFKKAHIENIFFYIVAFAIHIQERIFDTEKEKLTQYAESLRPHTKQWYINTLKSFQLGYSLDEDGKYKKIDEKAQIIKYCSLRIKGGELYFLIATDDNGTPQKISDNTKIASIKNYAERVFDAGVHFKLFSNDADTYRCKLLINYDPLVLDTDGKRLDGTNDKPVSDAIKNYFISFPFDSEFSNMALIDAIQKVEGVRVVELTGSMAKSNIAGSVFIPIESTYIANAGYMMFDEINSQICYVI
ncbi:MAG: hypothetical protein LBI45_02165 [Bacteroidales bacterium]|jgi:hypothetical protein|nr:hypothetical protein [Bacteroidales bacterium]